MRTIVLLAGICALLASNWATAQTALSASQAYKAASDGSLLLIDLRTARELAETGQPEAAVWIPIQANDFADQLLAAIDGDLNSNVAFICASGGRSGVISSQLAKLGFSNVYDVREGMLGSQHGAGWLANGLPTVSFRPDESL